MHDQHPSEILHRPQPRRRRADGDRQRARPAQPGGSRRLSAQAAQHPALPRHLRRQHGGRLHARRRERVGAQARRGDAHALRGEERQLHPLRDARDRGRGEAPDRGLGRRRHGRAGDAAVRRAARHHAQHAQQGRRARLPLLPRPRPAAAGARRRLGREPEGRAAGTAGRQARPLRARLRHSELRRRRAGGRAGDGGFLRGGGEGPRRQARRQLGDRRFLRRPQPHRQDDRDHAGFRRRARRPARPDGRRHDQRPHRQGRVRGRWSKPARTPPRSSRRRACAR